jgi:hypothetical protein
MHMKLLAVFQMEDGNYRLPRKILYIYKVASLPLEVTLRHWYICMYVCVYAWMYVCICVCMYDVCMYVCVCMYACMHVYMYVCMYV